jgi:hypothetical protein
VEAVCIHIARRCRAAVTRGPLKMGRLMFVCACACVSLSLCTRAVAVGGIMSVFIKCDSEVMA